MNLEHDLAQLENAQLVRRLQEEERAYLFKHALTQESAYESLLVKTRRAMHRRVAEAYEQLYPERMDEFAALLAQHYAEAVDDAKTLEYATRAGDVAMRVYANAEAIASYSQALEIVRRIGVQGFAPPQIIHLYTRHGRALEMSGRYEEALANYRVMEEVGDARSEPSLKLAGLMARATINSIPSSGYDPALARALSDQALQLARASGDKAAEAKVLWNLMLLNSRGEMHLREAIEYGEQSLALARELNLREQLAYTLNDLATPYAFFGQTARAKAAEEEARALWIELNNLPMLSSNYAYSVMTRVTLAEFAEAVTASQEAFRLSESIGDTWGMAFSLTWVGPAYLQLGEIGQAIRVMEQGITLGQEAKFVAPAVINRSDLGRLYAELGKLERALAEVKRASAHALPGYNIVTGWGMGTAAHLAVLAGQYEEADGLIQDVWHHLTREDATLRVTAYVWLAEIELALARQHDSHALELSQQLIARLTRLSLSQSLLDAYPLQARALRRLGRVEEARQALREGLALTEARGAVWSEWKIRSALSAVEAQRGDTAEAESQRTKARELIEYVAARTPEDLRETFLNLPEVRRVLQESAPVKGSSPAVAQS
jgi:tetratricopeptide (TPR) repeat protein